MDRSWNSDAGDTYPGRLLGRDEIERYLRLVGRHLHQRGLTGEILILGGAYMTVVIRQREATRDVDAYFATHADAIREAAASVAEEEKLPSDWLNDAVKGFLYKQPETSLWLECPGLRVFMPSMDYIFAMKAFSGRAEDVRDLRALRDRLGLSSAQEAMEIVERYIPERLLTPRVRLLLEVVFEEE
jgi:hypothetical protein